MQINKYFVAFVSILSFSLLIVSNIYADNGKPVMLESLDPNIKGSYTIGQVEFKKDAGGGSSGTVNPLNDGKTIRLKGTLADYDDAKIALILPFDSNQNIKDINVVLSGDVKQGNIITVKLVSGSGDVLVQRQIDSKGLNMSQPKVAKIDFGQSIKNIRRIVLAVHANGAPGEVLLNVQGLGGVPPEKVDVSLALDAAGSYEDNTGGDLVVLNDSDVSNKGNGVRLRKALNSDDDWAGLSYRFNGYREIDSFSLLLRGIVSKGQQLKIELYGENGKLFKEALVKTQRLTNSELWQVKIGLKNKIAVREIKLLVLANGNTDPVDIQVIGLGKVKE
ncbi:MAG: hypothetical protein P9M13_01430 [Candidatus Ancaeobacter aquaticus]|nr:hypothetical protein [Candidatus Ancaeobacter aquaticus]